MTLPLITECKKVHRAFHFPQFKVLNPAEFRDQLRFSAARKRNDGFAALFQQAGELMDNQGYKGFIAACELVADKYDYECYLDLKGRVVFLLHEDR